MNNDELQTMCKTIREDILVMINKAKSGHPGGSLSATELVTALYFGGILNYDAKKPDWDGRDYFILSKGHACPVVYAALARAGFFPLEELGKLRKLGAILQGHPNALHTPGFDCSSGSLGQGLSIANGIALAMKKQGKTNRVYCLMGDGEIQEGQIWEAAMTASQHKLDNICAMLDSNGIQLDGRVSDIMEVEPVKEKWASFGWNVIECDGHDVGRVMDAYASAAATQGKPSIIIARTIKGKGVSFMENDANWHGNAPNDEQLAEALAEVRAKEAY
ncbi:MAG: transketolase [Oscillospiraceae bacterium]|nr:transketolase [Oscillospiraceae bacterium]